MFKRHQILFIVSVRSGQILATNTQSIIILYYCFLYTVQNFYDITNVLNLFFRFAQQISIKH